jgi:hypothetical protein
MRSIVIMLAGAVAWLPSFCIAADHLAEVKSEVFESRGSPTELRSRARICIEKLGRHDDLRTGDEERGVLVTHLQVRYGLRNIATSEMTFEARQDRFRITHASVARNTKEDGEFAPVAIKRGSGWKRVEKALQAKSNEIADCVKSADRAQLARRNQAPE